MPRLSMPPEERRLHAAAKRAAQSIDETNGAVISAPITETVEHWRQAIEGRALNSDVRNLLRNAAIDLRMMLDIDRTEHPESNAEAKRTAVDFLNDMATAAKIEPDDAQEIFADAFKKPAANDDKPKENDRLANFVFSGDETLAPQAMLIDGVMPLQGLPFIGGQSSAGKTFVAVMLACCAATGKPFMGREVRVRVGSVIVAAEGRPMLAARIVAALKTLSITEPVPVSWIKQVPDFSRTESMNDFIENLRAVSAHYRVKFAIPLGLVFVDTVSGSFDIKEEADNAEAARVCKIMRGIADATGVVIVPIHHYGKNAGVGLRGASAWRANADFVLSVMADIDPATGHVTNRQLAIAKDRDGAQGPLTPFELVPVDLGAIDSKPWGSLAAVAGKAGQPTKQWSEHLRIFRQALSTALVNHGKNERPFADGPEVKAVTEDQVRAEFNRIAHVDSPPEKRQDALRKQFSRKLIDAQSKGLVGVHNDAAGHTVIWFVSGKDEPPDTKSTS